MYKPFMKQMIANKLLLASKLKMRANGPLSTVTSWLTFLDKVKK